MRRRISSISLVVVALGAALAATGEPVPWNCGDIRVMAVGEPNDPNARAPGPASDPNRTWDPAAHVVASWESLTLMSRLYNPSGASGKKLPERSLSLSARVDVIDVNGLIGFDSAATGTLVLDERGGEVYRKPVPSRYCHFYWPLRYLKKMSATGPWVSELQPYNLTVSMPMDPNRPYPLVLSKVEWSMFALVPGEIKTVDIPFRPTTDWLTLTPGLEIKVEQVTAQSNRYDYRIATRYSRSKVVWAASGAAIALWTQDPTPEVIVTKLDVLDPLGMSIQDQGGGSFGSSAGAGGAGDLSTGTATGNGNCEICGTATTFRFTLALKPSQRELRFVLENVPVPIL